MSIFQSRLIFKQKKKKKKKSISTTFPLRHLNIILHKSPTSHYKNSQIPNLATENEKRTLRMLENSNFYSFHEQNQRPIIHPIRSSNFGQRLTSRLEHHA